MFSLTVKSRLEKPLLLRKKDLLPGVVYGKDVGNLLIQLSSQEFEKIYKEVGESTIINLKIQQAIANSKGESSASHRTGKQQTTQEFPVLIREIQKDPLSGKFIHVDFYQLPMEKEVEVTVPLEFVGKAPAEQELGGVLIKNIREVEIRTLPKNLITSIKVDVSNLKTFEDEIKIKDLVVPEGVKILANSDEIVALVGEVEEEKVEEAPTEETTPKEPEVIKKEKQKEEEEEEEKEEKKS